MTHGKEPEKTQQWYKELKHEDGTDILNAIQYFSDKGSISALHEY